MKGKKITELQVGESMSIQRTITETDVVMYGGISGDLNPAHFNEVYAKDTMFKGRIVHGMLTASYFSAVLGMHLPGPGTIYLGQELRFMKPVRFLDTIKAVVTVKELNMEKNIAIMETVAYNQNDEVVLKGTATVMPPK